MQNMSVTQWVEETARLTQPSEIVWCDGSPAEWERLASELVANGTLIQLNPKLRPNSFLARTAPSDVARVEDRTFICSATEEDAGPTNNWREPTEMKQTLSRLFKGSMRGRTMFVVPFSMGAIDSNQAQYGVEITDSAYVVLSMHLMTRVSNRVFEKIIAGASWVPGLHSVGAPLIGKDGEVLPDSTWPCNDEKYIAHFTETNEIWSFGSGYGGNALLGKKCLALRIGSNLGRHQGWLAEHMLLIKLTSPAGRNFHIAAAFPSACGKTNLAMLQPSLPGWTVSTIGDDIAWIAPDSDGRLRAINPEAGFFGVAPGTGLRTNPVAVQTIAANTLFTNVALTDDGDVWWEGLTDETPAHLIDWTGKDWTPDSETPAAHPNSRFTVSISQCPTIDPNWDSPMGVPLDAILFGGRRATNVPLVVEARSWEHGVFMGATISSEQTAAAEGVVGTLRRDPFAMLPFCGYNMADYWQHWLNIGAASPAQNLPKVFQVNWFRKGSDGKFLWPGFSENIRVLEWIAKRLENAATAVDSAIGGLPVTAELNVEGLKITDQQLKELFEVDANLWLHEVRLIDGFFSKFGKHLPAVLTDQLDSLKERLTEGVS